MGYYTKYNIEVLDKNTLKPTLDYGLVGCAIEDICEASGYNSPFGDECKWYTHEQDLLEVSNIDVFKNVIFKLASIGEEDGDMWHKYFYNGKMQVCKAVLTYPPFDETKLQ